MGHASRLIVCAALLGAAALAGRPARAEETPAVETLAVVDGSTFQGLRGVPFVRFGDRIVFSGQDAAGGVEPWISDGTVAGTRRLVDLEPGAGASACRFHGSVGGMAVFDGRAGSSSHGLWAVHPDSGTVVRLTDPDLKTPIVPMSFAAAGPRAVFEIIATGSVGLWTTDGTREGTRRLVGVPQPQPSPTGGLLSSGDRAFYVADDGVHGIEPWTTDGTEAGTTLIRDFAAGAANSLRPHAPVFGGVAAADGSFFFPERGGIWATGGAPGEERLVHSMGQDFVGGGLDRLAPLSGALYFMDASRRLAGMRTTAPWGVRAYPLRDGRWLSGAPLPLAASGPRVFVSVALRREKNKERLWAADAGTDRGRLVRARDGRLLRRPLGRMVPIGDTGAVVFTGPPTRGVGAELWISDGSRRGTRLLADVASGPASSNADPLVVLGGRLLCVTRDPTTDVRTLIAVDLPR